MERRATDRLQKRIAAWERMHADAGSDCPRAVLSVINHEIGVLRRQCLDRRIDNRRRLEREIAAWERQRNAAGARIQWMFTTGTARIKLGRAYPNPAAAEPRAKES